MSIPLASNGRGMNLDAEISSINVITQEEIPRIRRASANFKQFHQIVLRNEHVNVAYAEICIYNEHIDRGYRHRLSVRTSLRIDWYDSIMPLACDRRIHLQQVWLRPQQRRTFLDNIQRLLFSHSTFTIEVILEKCNIWFSAIFSGEELLVCRWVHWWRLHLEIRQSAS